MRIIKKYVPIIIIMIATSFLSVFVYSKIYKTEIIETSKTVSEVNITDEGISYAVDKIYDSVVVVKSYINGRLYASGTGFFFQEENDLAYILTNNHVIASATSITITLTNGEIVDSEIVGKDEYADVAVLSVPKSKVLSIAKIGSSEELRIGDTTFAVGAPVDSDTYSWTVTRGIISGKDRLVEISNGTSGSYLAKLIQTDAAINSGNSGGPLCNVNGEVIGITNLKLASDSIEGMSFAIPIEDALDYAKKFIAGESIKRPYIGISVYDTSNLYIEIEGIYVDSVIKDGPADKAGLRHGDLITKVNNNDVRTFAEFKYELYKYQIGDKINITYVRNNKEITVNIELYELNA